MSEGKTRIKREKKRWMIVKNAGRHTYRKCRDSKRKTTKEKDSDMQRHRLKATGKYLRRETQLESKNRQKVTQTQKKETDQTQRERYTDRERHR